MRRTRAARHFAAGQDRREPGILLMLESADNQEKCVNVAHETGRRNACMVAAMLFAPLLAGCAPVSAEETVLPARIDYVCAN
jgi:hypothetical protein